MSGRRQTGGHPAGRSKKQKDPPPDPGPLLAPYNFVPPADHVFIPEPTRAPVDIPFKDGLSGQLEVKFTAKTPLFIRGPNDRSPEFYRLPCGTHAIPGSTVRGMLRNVVSIATFSRLSTSLAKRRFAFRDLSKPDLYGAWMSKNRGGAFEPKVHAGWLHLDETTDEWMLTPCSFGRVEHDDLARWFGRNGEAVASKKTRPASAKYRAWRGKLTINCQLGELVRHDRHSKPLIYRKVERNSGSTKGTLVFTGQAGKKHLEFVFFDEAAEAYAVPEKVRKDFLFIHDELDTDASGDWRAYWQEKLNRHERVPIFYLAYDGAPSAEAETVALDQGGALYAMGLAMMFRLPYTGRIKQGLTDAHHDKEELDCADLLFGTVGKKPLKSRLSFDALEASNTPRSLETTRAVLSTPKPSFYPSYLQQAGGIKEKVTRHTTYMDSKFTLSGWKRYPVSKDGAPVRVNVAKGLDGVAAPNDKIETQFQPLAAGAEFQGAIRFHNLRPWELGIVIWALTFGEIQPEAGPRLRHSLGMARPLGYGSVAVELTSASAVNAKNQAVDVDLTACVTKFKEHIELWLHSVRMSAALESTAQVHELLTMADPALAQPDRLKYPEHVSEFVKYKNALRVLPRYSTIAGSRRPPAPAAPVRQLSPQEEDEKKLNECKEAGTHVVLIESWIDEGGPRESERRQLARQMFASGMSKRVRANVKLMNWLNQT